MNKTQIFVSFLVAFDVEADKNLCLVHVTRPAERD